jgi:endonuclease/exonuclease/phosphatase family metal-dependent hydrolase
MQHRILISNLGYARHIDGTLLAHLLRSRRHLHTSQAIQKASLDAYKQIVQETRPDLCCLIEIDTGSFTSGGLNQFEYLANGFSLRDVSSKYAEGSKLAHFALTKGKCNGFMAARPYPFNRLYFSRGSKRLVYRIELEPALTLLFTHLALGQETRTQQLKELRALADLETGETLIAGDFNILAGLGELSVFVDDGRYTLLNHPERSTFTLFGRHYLLDLCLASAGAAPYAALQVINQPFSDHDALLVSLNRD